MQYCEFYYLHNLRRACHRMFLIRGTRFISLSRRIVVGRVRGVLKDNCCFPRVSLRPRRTGIGAPPTSESFENSEIVSRQHVECEFSLSLSLSRARRGQRKRQSCSLRFLRFLRVFLLLVLACELCSRRRAWNSKLTAKFLTKFGGCPRTPFPALDADCQRCLSCRFFWGFASRCTFFAKLNRGMVGNEETFEND